MLQVSQRDFTEHVRAIARSSGVEIPQAEADLHFKHASALLEWNSRFNITTITSIEDIIIKHILDSLMVCVFFPLQGTLADLGSGGGFPGLSIKIHTPALQVTLIEANRKKANFLRYAIRTTGLHDIAVYHGRAEAPDAPAGFDWIVSRALSRVETVCERAQPLLKEGGRLVCMRGPCAQPEHAGTLFPGRFWQDLHTHTYALPQNKGRRTLVLLKKCFT